MSKYGVFPVSYFHALGLNTERYSVRIRENTDEKKLRIWTIFRQCVKDRKVVNNGEKLDGHITDKDYLTCKKILNEFNMKNMGDYHSHYLKKDVLLLVDVFEKFIHTW